MKEIWMIAVASMIIVSVCANSNGGEQLESKYKTGQVWSYQTREGEEKSRICIVKVEKYDKNGFVYHIYVDSLKIKTPQMKKGVQEVLPHSPVSDKSLDASVVKLIETKRDGLPDITEGYKQWKDAKGGAFTIPVREIIQIIENALNRKQ